MKEYIIRINCDTEQFMNNFTTAIADTMEAHIGAEINTLGYAGITVISVDEVVD